MIIAIDRWVQSHRYQVIIRQLKSLSEPELAALGIAVSGSILRLPRRVDNQGVKSVARLNLTA